MMDDTRLLTSLSNPLIKKTRALKKRKARVEHELFVVEGLHHVGSVLEAGWDIDTLFFAPELLAGEFSQTLLEKAQRLGISPKAVTARIMESLAEKDNPQGILAVVRQRKLGFLDLGKIRSGIALISPQDPGNVGTILRTIDAVGADVLFLLDPVENTRSSVDLYHPTCVRSSMGTLFWKPVISTSFELFVNWAKENKVLLIGTSARGKMNYRDFQTPASTWLLVLGSEQKGLTLEQLESCNQIVSLPMLGRVSSLNLSVAAGVLLYAFTEM